MNVLRSEIRRQVVLFSSFLDFSQSSVREVVLFHIVFRVFRRCSVLFQTFVQEFFDELLLRSLVGKVLSHHFFCNNDGEVSHSLANFSKCILFLCLNLLFCLLHHGSTFVLCFFTCLLDDVFAGLFCLFEDFSLLVACFIQHSLAFQLDVCQFLVGFACFPQSLVNVVFAFFHHLDDDGEPKLCHKEEDHEECQQHPKEETGIRS